VRFWQGEPLFDPEPAYLWHPDLAWPPQGVS
jgi:hypothetical protein